MVFTGCDETPLAATLYWHQQPAAGESVVLISPAICSPRQLYAPLSLRLALNRPVIVYDHRCHNGNKGRFSIELMAEDLKAILSQLQARGLKVGVVGHSLGGMLCGIACARGASMAGQILMAAPPSLVTTCRKVPHHSGQASIYLYNLIRAIRSPHYLRQLIERELFFPWDFIRNPSLLALSPGDDQCWNDVLREIWAAPGIAEYAETIRKSAMPTLFLWGSMDSTHGLTRNGGNLPTHFRKYVETVTRGNSSASLEILPGLSHYFTKDKRSAVPIASDNTAAPEAIERFLNTILD
jgi:pimeloyl-ACP methyl ester carboxylesterase